MIIVTLEKNFPEITGARGSTDQKWPEIKLQSNMGNRIGREEASV